MRTGRVKGDIMAKGRFEGCEGFRQAMNGKKENHGSGNDQHCMALDAGGYAKAAQRYSPALEMTMAQSE